MIKKIFAGINSYYGKYFFGGVFMFFCVVIIGATLYYRPWWGVMDDGGNLLIIADFWKHPGINPIYDLIKIRMVEWGRFLPIYQFWIIIIYSVFRSFPTGAYICIALTGLAVLIIWGKIINKVFPSPKDYLFNLYIYPLSFFIFTPFWNNFMYISVLEKFIYLFSTLSFYFFICAYESNKLRYLGISFLFTALCILSKETGVALAGAFCVYSFLDVTLFHKNKKFSLITFMVNTLILISYYFFIRTIWGGTYSQTYQNNFSIAAILASFLSASLIIKGLVLLSAISVLGAVFIIRKKNTLITQEYLLFPFFLGAYLIILSPWGFLNYHLAPAAPALMLAIYPFYLLIGTRNEGLSRAFKCVLIFLILFVLFFIIIPRISKMADIKKTVKAIISLQDERTPARFFMAPPFEETAVMLSIYTNTNIVFLKTGVLEKEMLKDRAFNYIIFEDRCNPLALHNALVKKEVYRNNTWKVFDLDESVGKTSTFKPVFERNLLEHIKDYVKIAR